MLILMRPSEGRQNTSIRKQGVIFLQDNTPVFLVTKPKLLEQDWKAFHSFAIFSRIFTFRLPFISCLFERCLISLEIYKRQKTWFVSVNNRKFQEDEIIMLPERQQNVIHSLKLIMKKNVRGLETLAPLIFLQTYMICSRNSLGDVQSMRVGCAKFEFWGTEKKSIFSNLGFMGVRPPKFQQHYPNNTD